MDFECDPVKYESSLEKHGLSLADADGFDWESAVVREDTREQYAEPRSRASRLIVIIGTTFVLVAVRAQLDAPVLCRQPRQPPRGFASML